MKHAFAGSKKEWDESDAAEQKQILRTYLRQVEAAAALSLAQKDALTIVERIVLVVVMMWLTWAGRVKGDNYNGSPFILGETRRQHDCSRTQAQRRHIQQRR